MANLDRSHLSFMQFYVEDFIRCSPFSTTSLSSVSVFLNFSVDDPAAAAACTLERRSISRLTRVRFDSYVAIEVESPCRRARRSKLDHGETKQAIQDLPRSPTKTVKTSTQSKDPAPLHMP